VTDSMTFEIERNTIHGQITLPASVRKELGIEEGEIAAQHSLPLKFLYRRLECKLSNSFAEGILTS